MPFDSLKFKEAIREHWDAVADGWNREADLMDQWLGSATDILLEMAAIGPGSRVLDIAAGTGHQTLQAAKRVGPVGYILATDISSNALRLAARNASAAGFRNVETQVADAENLNLPPESFDAVISRLGLFFFPDLQKALAGMGRVLKPGGRIAGMVYSTPEKNAFLSLPMSIIQRRAHAPPPVPGQPSSFALGNPGALEQAFRTAGFRDIVSRTVQTPIRMDSASSCARFLKQFSASIEKLLADLDDSGRVAAWREVEDELRRFEGKEGFVGPSEMVIAVGVK